MHASQHDVLIMLSRNRKLIPKPFPKPPHSSRRDRNPGFHDRHEFGEHFNAPDAIATPVGELDTLVPREIEPAATRQEGSEAPKIIGSETVVAILVSGTQRTENRARGRRLAVARRGALKLPTLCH
jgi:hypothetical protein